ncbi:MAG: hypothetical protein GXP55_12810 [Deltaproteobacteria bacterium]|nr:hypothetical protein [Deltaproteobacteria bacterium]
MPRSRFLPDDVTLERLVQRATASPEGPEVAVRPGRIRFGAPRAVAARSIALATPTTDAAPTAWDRAEITGELPTLAGANADVADLFDTEVMARPVEGRLELLVSWLMGATGAFAVFVADREGLPLVNRHAPEDYVVATAALARAQEGLREFFPGMEEPSMIVDLGDGNVLETISAATDAGYLVLGMVVASKLDVTLVREARRALVLAVAVKNVEVGNVEEGMGGETS